MTKSNAYQSDLIAGLRDPREAQAYLNAALEEETPEAFLVALKNVEEAQGGMAQITDRTGLNRERLSHTLSNRETMDLKSLVALLHALGFRLVVTSAR